MPRGAKPIDPKLVEMMEYLHVRGVSCDVIAEFFSLHRNTVYRYVSALPAELKTDYQARIMQNCREELEGRRPGYVEVATRA